MPKPADDQSSAPADGLGSWTPLLRRAVAVEVPSPVIVDAYPEGAPPVNELSAVVVVLDAFRLLWAGEASRGPPPPMPLPRRRPPPKVCSPCASNASTVGRRGNTKELAVSSAVGIPNAPVENDCGGGWATEMLCAEGMCLSFWPAFFWLLKGVKKQK